MSTYMSSFVRGGGAFSQVSAGFFPAELGGAHRPGAEIAYTFRGKRCTVADFLAEHCATGLLVLRDGEVLVEEYARGNRPTIQWNGFSMAKFIVMLLVGAAIRDGAIESVDDPAARYLPALAGTAYDEVTLRDLLQMATGIGWMESYRHPRSHLAVMVNAIASGGTDEFTGFMRGLVRVAPRGTQFNYSSGEVHLVGMILAAATGRGLGEYLSEKIWVPFGMEEDAFWRLSAERGLERSWCCLYASLRDWARLGQAALTELDPATASGVLADGWMEQATASGAGSADYGYLTWLGTDGFSASGLHGQRLHVDPRSRLVIAILSRWPEAYSDARLTLQTTFVSQLVHRFRNE